MITINDSQSTNDSAYGGILFFGLNDFPVTVTYFITNFCIAIVAISVISLNALVIHALRCQWSSLDVCYLFILNLAIGDLLTGLVFIYTVFFNIINFTLFYECLFRFGLVLMIFNSTGLHFMILTLDRVIRIAYPYRHSDILSRKRALWIVISIWAYAFFSSMTSFFGWHKELSHDYCLFFGVLSNSYLVLHMTVLVLVIGAVLVLYWHLYRISRRHAVAIAVQQGIISVTKVNFDLKHAYKFTKTAIVLFGAFFVCWMPTVIIIFLHVVHQEHDAPAFGVWLTYSSFLVAFNSLINPIIYALKIPEIKKYFKRTFCKLCGKA